MTDRALTQKRVIPSSSSRPFKRSRKEVWQGRGNKKGWRDFRLENVSRSTIIGGNRQDVCSYYGHAGHTIDTCYRKLGLCYLCGKSGHLAGQCPEARLAPTEAPKRVGRPPIGRGVVEQKTNKPQVKARAYALDGQPIEAEANVVEDILSPGSTQ